MDHIRRVLLVSLINVLLWSGCSSTVSVLRSHLRDQPLIVDYVHPDAVVTVDFSNSYNQTGWAILEVHGVSGHSNDDMAYYAGYAEGNQTADLVYLHYVNSVTSGDILCNDDAKPLTKFCQDVDLFVQTNFKYMNDQIAENPNSHYWNMIHLYLKQLEGLADGYKSNKHLPPLSMTDFINIQINNDVGNLQQAFSSGTFPRFNANIGDGKCSAFVKLLPDNSDLYTSHDTWTEYQSMIRIYKLYDLPYQLGTGRTVPASAIAMSSYPGKLQSEDDYYILGSGLVTMETTNGNSNPDLWKNLSPSTVFEPIRVMVASRLARSGREWTQIFAQYNSGTYNNQWIVVDYNLFKPGGQLPSSDLLWILEQLPGYIMYGDETRVLVNQSYWASYNIPYYSSIFEASDMNAYVEKYGDWFTHSGSPRAKIFARNHSDVVDMESLIKLMRYNNFKHDPLSVCNCTPPYSGENSISARSDLNPVNGTYPFSALSHRLHGGTDNKATNSMMVKELQSLATCGPTHDQQPVFSWSTSGVDKPLGHADVFDFPTIQIKWNLK